MAERAPRVWCCQMDFDHPEVTALEGIEAFRSFLISIGMPKNFEELGAKGRRLYQDISNDGIMCRYDVIK